MQINATPMVEVFVTNVTGKPEAKKVIDKLDALCTGCVISIDLDDCDKILRIEGERIECSNVISFMNRNGYACRRLE
jgi:hypothetical protein